MARLLHSRAASLESVLAGERAPSAAEAPLAELALELRDFALATPQPSLHSLRREELRQAVLAQRAAQASSGSLSRARGVIVGVAALAGGGLVVASAATGSNPAVLVVDAAREIPGLSLHSQPSASISMEGEVIATHDGGRTLEVRSNSDTVVVIEAPRDLRSVTSEGTAVPAAEINEGDTVRVTTDRRVDSGVVPAKKIEILPTAAADIRAPAPAAANPADEKTPASNTGAAPIETVRPAPTRTPTATPTPKPAVTNVATVPVLDPAPPSTPTPTPTPRPDPKRTPVPTDDDSSTDELSKDNAVAPGITAPD